MSQESCYKCNIDVTNEARVYLCIECRDAIDAAEHRGYERGMEEAAVYAEEWEWTQRSIRESLLGAAIRALAAK
jgi:hypothetical protein